MEMIKELFNYTGINIKKEHWNTYDEMNKIIIFIFSDSVNKSSCISVKNIHILIKTVFL